MSTATDSRQRQDEEPREDGDVEAVRRACAEWTQARHGWKAWPLDQQVWFFASPEGTAALAAFRGDSEPAAPPSPSPGPGDDDEIKRVAEKITEALLTADGGRADGLSLVTGWAGHAAWFIPPAQVTKDIASVLRSEWRPSASAPGEGPSPWENPPDPGSAQWYIDEIQRAHDAVGSPLHGVRNGPQRIRLLASERDEARRLLSERDAELAAAREEAEEAKRKAASGWTLAHSALTEAMNENYEPGLDGVVAGIKALEEERDEALFQRDESITNANRRDAKWQAGIREACGCPDMEFVDIDGTAKGPALTLDRFVADLRAKAEEAGPQQRAAWLAALEGARAAGMDRREFVRPNTGNMGDVVAAFIGHLSDSLAAAEAKAADAERQKKEAEDFAGDQSGYADALGAKLSEAEKALDAAGVPKEVFEDDASVGGRIEYLAGKVEQWETATIVATAAARVLEGERAALAAAPGGVPPLPKERPDKEGWWVVKRNFKRRGNKRYSWEAEAVAMWQGELWASRTESVRISEVVKPADEWYRLNDLFRPSSSPPASLSSDAPLGCGTFLMTTAYVIPMRST